MIKIGNTSSEQQGEMAEEGKFMLRLSKSLWNKAESSSAANAALLARQREPPPEPPIVKKKNCSEECVICGRIALAGKKHCISCHMKKKSGTSDKDIREQAGIKASPAPRPRTTSVLRLGKGGIVKGTFAEPPPLTPTGSSSSGGGRGSKGTPMTPGQCSRIIEKEMEYIHYLLEKLPPQLRAEMVQGGVGDAHMSCMGVMSYTEVSSHLSKLRLDPIHRLVRPILTIGGILCSTHAILEASSTGPWTHGTPTLANYLAKVTNPIDLGTIRARLQRGEFETITKTGDDMLMVFDNAMTYNAPEHHLHQLARIMRTELEGDLRNLDEKMIRETERKHNHGSSCKLCQGEVQPVWREVPEVRGCSASVPWQLLAAH